MNAAEVYPPVLHTLKALQQLVNVNRLFGCFLSFPFLFFEAHHVTGGRGQTAPTGALAEVTEESHVVSVKMCCEAPHAQEFKLDPSSGTFKGYLKKKKKSYLSKLVV